MGYAWFIVLNSLPCIFVRKTSFPCHSALPFYFDSTRDGCLKRVVSLKPGKNGGLPWLRIVCIILNHHHIVRDSGTLVEVQALCIIFVLFNILSGKQPIFSPPPNSSKFCLSNFSSFQYLSSLSCICICFLILPFLLPWSDICVIPSLLASRKRWKSVGWGCYGCNQPRLSPLWSAQVVISKEGASTLIFSCCVLCVLGIVYNLCMIHHLFTFAWL